MQKLILFIFIQLAFAAGIAAQVVTPRALTPEQHGDENDSAGKYTGTINY